MAALTDYSIQRYPLHAPGTAAPTKALAIYVIEASTVAAAGGHIVTGATNVLNILSADANETAADATTARGTATGTITFNDAGGAGETVTIDGIVYTQDATPAADSWEFDVGASATATGAALAAAINRTGTPGTQYAVDIAPHPSVSAADASGVVTLTARVPGAGGNSITLAASDTATSVTLSGTVLSGGADYAVGSGVKVRSFPNSQTASTTEDDAGDIFIDHGGSGNENIRIVALVTERNA